VSLPGLDFGGLIPLLEPILKPIVGIDICVIYAFCDGFETVNSARTFGEI